MRISSGAQWRLTARYRLGTAILLATIASSGPILEAARKKAATIGPGPTTMSASERELEADPEAGIEHAIILVEETVRNEDLGADMEVRFHMRAKILSNEGRDLANVEIPLVRGRDKLKDWWGRTILPDGTVHELAQEELESQSVVKTRASEIHELKAALPGAVPGCVIDYGYTVHSGGYVPFDRIPLQRRWPIREFRFDWTPNHYLTGAYRVVRADALRISPEFKQGRLKVLGQNLPPVVDEPLMPPLHMLQGALVLYYVSLDYDNYWDELSKIVEQLVRASVEGTRSAKRVLAEMNLPEGDLDTKLRAAYDWIGANITRTGLRTFEEIEESADEEGGGRDLMAQLLEAREGSAEDVHRFMIGIARAIGAEAYLVFVTDRTERIWDPLLRSWSQFDGTLVALAHRGTEDGQLVIVDPGSGLPYGTIPWRLAGARGLMITKSKGVPVRLPTPNAGDSVSKCDVEASFSAENESVVANWSQVGTGQIGLDERRYLRRLAPDDRRERMEQLCGVEPDTEILNAEVAGLEDLTRNLELSCEIESYTEALGDRVGYFQFPWAGPWVPALPDLPDAPRRYPVVFDFPRVDLLSATFESPHGFEPEDPPEPVRLEVPFGRYALSITRTETGFKVERALGIYDLALPADEYEALRAFYEDVRRLDRTPLSFRRAGIE